MDSNNQSEIIFRKNGDKYEAGSFTLNHIDNYYGGNKKRKETDNDVVNDTVIVNDILDFTHYSIPTGIFSMNDNDNYNYDYDDENEKIHYNIEIRDVIDSSLYDLLLSNAELKNNENNNTKHKKNKTKVTKKKNRKDKMKKNKTKKKKIKIH